MQPAVALPRHALPMLLLASLCLVFACTSRVSPDSKPSESGESGEMSVRPGINKAFLDGELDVHRFVEMFEGESREVFASRARIVDALALSPGSHVADIGAGTGAFLPVFDRAVGPEGRVYAVDISPKFLEHLQDCSFGVLSANMVLCAYCSR